MHLRLGFPIKIPPCLHPIPNLLVKFIFTLTQSFLDSHLWSDHSLNPPPTIINSCRKTVAHLQLPTWHSSDGTNGLHGFHGNTKECRCMDQHWRAFLNFCGNYLKLSLVSICKHSFIMLSKYLETSYKFYYLLFNVYWDSKTFILRMLIFSSMR